MLVYIGGCCGALCTPARSVPMRTSAVLLRPARSAGRRLLSSAFARHTVDNDPDFESFRNNALVHAAFIDHVRRSWPLRSSARRMIPAISDENILGFATQQERKKGTLLDFVCAQKERHPDKVLLVRVGEFYEAFGVDALLLVEHCGLNQMGAKARAGCPIRNIQQTLDGLTNVGLSVAVFEEMSDALVPKKANGAAGGGIKDRFLAQVVSPGAGTYIYNAAMRTEDIEYRESRSVLGVQMSSGGGVVSSTVSDTQSGSRADGSLHYTVFEVFLDSRMVRVNERLTEDAARCIIDASVKLSEVRSMDSTPTGGMVSKLYIAKTGGGDISARTKRVVLGGTGANSVAGTGLATAVVRLWNAEKNPSMFLEDLLASIARDMEVSEIADVSTFRIIGAGLATSAEEADDKLVLNRFAPPRPLYAPTAQQLGVLPSAQVPDLVGNLLPSNDAPASARAFLRRWVLRPPPPAIADEMQALLTELTRLEEGLPPLRTVISTGKLVSLVRSRQANATMFRDLVELLETASLLLQSKEYRFVQPLVRIVGHECGVSVEPDAMRERCEDVLRRVKRTIHEDFPSQSDWDLFDAGDEEWCNNSVQPAMFNEMFRKNEYDFRSALLPNASAEITMHFKNVDTQRHNLVSAIVDDFLDRSTVGETKNIDLKYDPLNNKIIFYKRPSCFKRDEDDDDETWVHPRDRHGRIMSNRFSSKRVETATSNYTGSCEDARRVAREELRKMCDDFVDHHFLISSVTAVQLNEILLATHLHAREAVRRNWTLPPLEYIGAEPAPASLQKRHLYLPGLRPYWMTNDSVVENDIDLEGQWLLTGANMSGKSTLLRSITAAALLANCGLAVPIAKERGVHSPIPRFDGYFLRTNGADCPTEGLSAFALEADDMRILLRDLTPRSLAAVDELGRGTAPREGAAIVGALLEEFDRRGCPTIFATHLQNELRDLNLDLHNTQYKVLAMRGDSTNYNAGGEGVTWTYELKDGVCENAYSLATARAHRVPDAILRRAMDLSESVGKSIILSERESIGCTVAQEKGIDDYKENIDGTSPSTLDVVMSFFFASRFCAGVAENTITTPIVLKSGWEPPPRIADKTACLYIINLKKLGQLYVGETESLSNRLQQHRRRFGDNIEFAILPLDKGGRTEALRLESGMIDLLQRKGFSLVNTRQ